jgi:hypothetical protein
MGERVIVMVLAPAGDVRTSLRDAAAPGVTLPAADIRMRGHPGATSDHNARSRFARRAGLFQATEIITGVTPRDGNIGGSGGKQRCIDNSGGERWAERPAVQAPRR